MNSDHRRKSLHTLKPGDILKQDNRQQLDAETTPVSDQIETNYHSPRRDSCVQIVDIVKTPNPADNPGQIKIMEAGTETIPGSDIRVQAVNVVIKPVLTGVSDQTKVLETGAELISRKDDNVQIVDVLKMPAPDDSEVQDMDSISHNFLRSVSQSRTDHFKSSSDSQQTDENDQSSDQLKQDDVEVSRDSLKFFEDNRKIKSTFILNCLQHGIETIVQDSSKHKQRDLLMTDFTSVQVFNLSMNGVPFVFSVYAPVAFFYFRDAFDIETEDFVRSICHEPLSQIKGGGHSGSDVYVTQDGRFILKTAEKKEANFLVSLFPGYYLNLNQHPKTLLPKYFGLFCYQRGAKKIRILVMNNVLPYSANILELYDIKGATNNNRRSKSNKRKPGGDASKTVILKDLDFLKQQPGGLFMGKDVYDIYMKSVERDCRVLQSYGIIDYSLLLGIYKHKEDINVRQNSSLFLQEAIKYGSPTSDVEETSQLDKMKNEYLIGPFNAHTSKGEKVSVCVGIIDILQSYTITKKMEHYMKSLVSSKRIISVNSPDFYSLRFQNFLKNSVFKCVPNLAINID